MSDTPRTDDRIIYGTLTGDDSIGAPWVNAPFARQLERELNAANEKIRRLEEAGDFMINYAEWVDIERWNKIKEAKP